MSGFDPEIARQLAIRDRFRRARWRRLTLAQRAEEMDRLQRQATATLRSSPTGYDDWLRRNMAQRAITVPPRWEVAGGA